MTLSAWSSTTLHATAFLASATFACTAPALWPFVRLLGGNLGALAALISAHAAGEVAGAVAALAIATRGVSMRAASVTSSSIGVIGAFLVVLAGAVSASMIVPPHATVFVATLGRALLGGWAGGARVLEAAYVTARDFSFIPSIRGFASHGATFGTIAAVALSAHPNAPSFLALVAVTLSLILFIDFFGSPKERRSRPHFSAGMEDEMDCNEDVHANSCNGGASPIADEESGLLADLSAQSFLRSKFSSAAASITAASLISLLFAFAIQETTTTPLVFLLYKWSAFQAALLFSAGNIATVVTFRMLQKASRRRHLSNRAILLCSVLLCMVCNAFFPMISGPSSWPWFVMCFILQTVAFTVGRSSANSLYDRLLSNRFHFPAQGVILVGGATCRIIAPFVAVHTFESAQAMALIYDLVASCLVACSIALILLYRHLDV